MTTRIKPPSLSDLARQLRISARATGDDRGLTLSGGARIAYRVRGRQVWFSVSRKDKPVGDTEISVFIAQCGVPVGARRIPSEGQRQIGEWYQVGFVWEEGETDVPV